MVKVLSFRLQQFLGLCTLLLVEVSPERNFLDIYLTTFFRVHNSGNTSAMRVIFFDENVQNLTLISKMQKKFQ